MFIKEELDKFERTHPKSKKLWQKAINVLPGGISHNIRTFGLTSIGGFPIMISSSHGPFIEDIDNIKYLDFWNGHFAMILGHNPPEVQEAVKNHLQYGWHFGTNTEYQIELASKLIDDNPSIEKVRFCTSGTEATMYATRLARAYTNRKLVAKAVLGWHGASDTLCYDVSGLINGKAPLGQLKADEAGIITFTINQKDSLEMIRKNSKQLAAIILEPILGGGGGFPVNTEFLKSLREETEKYGIVLIFDEVITGYRFTNSLFQNELKILPDLTTMGKIIGGGFPIGAIGGKEEIIERSSPQNKNQVLIGGGTFSGYPLSMIAGLKTLEILKRSQQDYIRINEEGSNLIKYLNDFFNLHKLPIVATGFKSIIMLHIMSKWIQNPSFSEIIEFTDERREALLQLALFNRGISGLHGLGALSMANTHKHILQVMNVMEEIAQPVSQSSLN
ncbi:MAG: aspartate aminotransferase family protein [Candidatus Hermodarchaeota archaeon]